MHVQGAKNLTEGPIQRQLFNLALPIMGTSFIQMAYSLTDMAWVGHLGSADVAAIGAVGILTWMANSISLLNKVGAEVGVGQKIGSRDEEGARSYASHNITIALLLSLLLGGLMFAFAYPVVAIYKMEPSITLKAIHYLRIVASAFPFIFLSAAFTGIHNAAGQSKTPFYINGCGLLMNMLLDPLLIFGFDYGVSGAAWATWISQGTVCMLFVYQLKKRSKLFGGFRFFAPLKAVTTRQIFKLGLPVALLNTFFSFINLFLARTASACGGHIGVMTLTGGGQIEALAWNTSQGFSTALSAFVAQNYAAQKKERVTKAYHSTLKILAIVGAFVTILFIFFGSQLFSLFVPEEAAYEAGGTYLRIDGYSMMLMMLEITTQGVFYGTGRTTPPAVISITLNTLRIPLALCFIALGWGINSVWWAISISSMLKGIVAFIWFSALQKKIL